MLHQVSCMGIIIIQIYTGEGWALARHYLGKNIKVTVVHKLTYVCNVTLLMLKKKSKKSKDHTGMYKQDSSLQIVLLVKSIKTVYLKELY